MDGAVISALAASGGSALGGITPIMSNYLIQTQHDGAGSAEPGVSLAADALLRLH
jgi:hypothetical protein